MAYVVIFLITLGVSFLFTLAIKKIAEWFHVVDKPGDPRKIHKKPIPLLGGVAIYCVLLAIVVAYYFFAPSGWPAIIDHHVSTKHLIGFFLAGACLIIGGIIDDKYVLKPKHLIIPPLCAIAVIIAFGLGADSVTNPFTGKQLFLDQWKVLLFWWHGLPRYLALPADIVTCVWLLGAIYTTKLLDGLDGLVSSITTVSAIIIGLVSIFFFVNEPTALLSFMTAGAFAGFLILNFNPAKIFLGEAGSTIAGFLLGVLAIISGAKFATAMLVLGIPILDTAWVIFRRIVIEHRSPFEGDRKHLHFRLLDAGFSQRQAVLILTTVSFLFGIAALFMQTSQKLTALVLVIVVMLLLLSAIRWKRRQTDGNAPS